MLGRDDASKPPQEHQPGLYDKVLGALGFGGSPQEKSETAGTSTSHVSKPADVTPKPSTAPKVETTSQAFDKHASAETTSPIVDKQSSDKFGSSSKPIHPDAYPLTATDDEKKASAAPTTEYTRPFSQELKGPQSSHAGSSAAAEGVSQGVVRMKISQPETPAKEDIKGSQPTEALGTGKFSSISSSSSSSSAASQPREPASTGGIAAPHSTAPTVVATAHGGTGKPGVVASSAVPTATVTAPSPGVTTVGPGTEHNKPSEHAYGTPGAHNAQGKKGMLEKVTGKAKNVVSALHEKAHDTKQKVGEKMHKK